MLETEIIKLCNEADVILDKICQQELEEKANETTCLAAASLNKLTSEQAKSCDDGEHGCPYCPWRDPMVTPANGDRFKLPNGKIIEVIVVNKHHTIAPEIEYSFPNWKRWDGGRKSYTRKLNDWHKVILGGNAIQRGKKPSKFYGNYEIKQAAFISANANLNKR